ncbi:hypothetical protein [uncultured Winogradskyella sp.]|uniref:hypothetical protein n=1 Tax=uncultured Winogradskyella sp. TaxID=395353 RepID=UPI00262E1EFD|nr:hypothetical protein [uncultured Winogradskyella sp.]
MIRFIFTLLLVPFLSYSQSTQRWKKGDLENLKIYTQLDIALQNPEKVEILDLGGQSLLKIPDEIYKFKNLRVLLFGWRPKKDLDSADHKLAKNTGGGYLHLDRNKGTVIDYNYIEVITPELLALEKLEYLELNYNLLKTLPIELANMKNLKQISLYGNRNIYINHEIVDKLEVLMPNCQFLTAKNIIEKRKEKDKE